MTDTQTWCDPIIPQKYRHQVVRDLHRGTDLLPFPRSTDTPHPRLEPGSSAFQLLLSLFWLPSIPFYIAFSLQPLLPGPPQGLRPQPPDSPGALGRVSRLSLPGCQGRAETHPVSRAEAIHNHCRAERAGWVHGAAGEVDLDRGRQVARRATRLSNS